MKIPSPYNGRNDFTGNFLRLFFDSVALIFCIKTHFLGIFLLFVLGLTGYITEYILNTNLMN